MIRISHAFKAFAIVLSLGGGLTACKEDRSGLPNQKSQPETQKAPKQIPVPTETNTPVGVVSPSPSPSPSPSVQVSSCMIPLFWKLEGWAAFATQTIEMQFVIDSLGNTVALYKLVRSDASSPGGAGAWDGVVKNLFVETRADGQCWISGIWDDADGSGGVEWVFDWTAETLDGHFWQQASPSGRHIWKAQKI